MCIRDRLKEPIAWLQDTGTIMTVLIVTQLWLSLGSGFLAFIAGFQGVDPSLFDACAIDGVRNRFQELDVYKRQVRQLTQTIGAPESKRKVVIGIPYPHKATENFGDVDGDGKDEDFLNPDDRRKVLDWYVQEAIRRFDAYEFEYIELWGFYWIEEAMTADEEAIAIASEVVHAADKKLMWIPYYNAPGYEKGSEYFDVTIMQPNYAFNSWTVDGTVGPERMVNTWDTCKENGFGIEVCV